MDIDADGDSDILTGSWPGELYLFRRADDGTFGASEKLTNAEGDEIDLGSASTVFAADWDSDSDLDLLVGDIRGNVWLVTNNGTNQEPAYGSGTRLELSERISQLACFNFVCKQIGADNDIMSDSLVNTARVGF